MLIPVNDHGFDSMWFHHSESTKVINAHAKGLHTSGNGLHKSQYKQASITSVSRIEVRIFHSKINMFITRFRVMSVSLMFVYQVIAITRKVLQYELSFEKKT